MGDNDQIASIADASKPNAGRIYDFLLGGNHNFEVDRQAAQQLLQIAPFFPGIARMIRWFLGEAVRQLATDGFTRFVDFASGLPTIDHIHQITPPGTTVIYSDIDPITVAYGQEILKDNPNARYIVCNASKPEKLLEETTVARLLDKKGKIAFGFNGIAWFLKDEEIRHAMKVLYDWADKGSRIFISDLDFTTPTPEAEAGMALYAKFGQPGYVRSLEALQGIIAPWRPIGKGFLPLDEWLRVKKDIASATQGTFGGMLKGAILEK